MAPTSTAPTPPVARLTWGQVRGWRLARQHLDRRVPSGAMLDVAARLAGVHAQVLSSAELTLWARVDRLAPDAVARALRDDRSLVKTWAMRGTLHLLPSSEYPVWQAALGTYRHFEKPAWSRAFGVTPTELDALVDAVGTALDGRLLTREELADEVARLTGSAALGDKLRESWGALLKPASFRGRLCFGPNAGQKVRFTRPDRWIGGWAPVDPDHALAEATRRFLGAHGPATREDLARWWGGSPAAGGRMLAALGEEVAPVEVDGEAAWALSEEVAGLEAATGSRTVRLLPAFDQYVIGSTRHAARLLPGDFKDRVHRPQGWVSPVLLVDGRMDGVWRHERSARRLTVTIEPFVTVPSWARRGAQEEAERLAAYLGGNLELVWAD
ncbi:MAG TPA: winged helix DNA-binding domain-containing protein [Acidimicrobiales bacterium]|nr:winged helix DNA-binding domain-containing protein [Acidimicrobiales bacterium]